MPVIFSSTERNTILNRKLTATQAPEQGKYCYWTPTVQRKVGGFNSLLQAFQNTPIGMNDMGGGGGKVEAGKKGLLQSQPTVLHASCGIQTCTARTISVQGFS